MGKAAKGSDRTIPALILHQWLPEWDEIRWNPDLKQARPDRKHFYLLSLPARLLKRLSGIQRRSVKVESARSEDIGIQRYHDKERSDEIREFVKFGYPWSDLPEKRRHSQEFADLRKPGWLPTAIVVNIPRAGAARRNLKLAEKDAIVIKDSADLSDAVFELPDGSLGADWKPKGLHPMEVIDGQHRLWAFEGAGSDEIELPVVAFYDLDISWQAYLFWTINIKPKRINASLAFDLYPLLRSEEWLDKFSGHPVYRETRSQELVEALWSHPDSAWYRRINMLGESAEQLGDRRPMVSQSAWVRGLMSTYVKSWAGRGTKFGGLFGSSSGRHEPELQWTRTQQAAFLIYMWRQVADAVRATRADWARALRAGEDSPGLDSKEDRAFVGKYSLFTTDQGVRGVLAITNDLCYVRSDALELAKWRAPDEATATDHAAVSRAMASLARLPVAGYLQDLAVGLAKFDWRTSAAPSLSTQQQRDKQALRGGSGYRQMRLDLVELLATEKGEVGASAKTVRDAASDT